MKPDDRPRIDTDLVRRLIAAQHPRWAHLDVRPMEQDGWDNRSFRLGPDLTVRLPSAAGYVPQVAKEIAWLPHLAAALPLPVPEIVAVGEPADGYPYPWTVRRWIPGSTLLTADPVDPGVLADDLAALLRALRAVPTGGGPGPGEHSSGRGAPLDQWDAQVRSTVAALGDRIVAARALALWDDALDAGSGIVPRSWFHGDVAPGNLLLTDGRLSAVIDFGLAGVGDPACDLAMAWTVLDAEPRARFRAAVDVDDATWRRGRGWALWKSLISLDDAVHGPGAARALRATGVLRTPRAAPGG